MKNKILLLGLRYRILLSMTFFFIIFLAPSKSQIVNINFDGNICAGNGCDMTDDLIGNGCILVNNPDIAIQGLGGFNKLTNDCNTWLNGTGFQYPSNLIPSSPRRLIFQNYANVAPYGSNSYYSIGAHSGIFFTLDQPYLKNNYFYQVRFNMEHIMPYPCSRISESGQANFRPGAPTISVYSKIVNDLDYLEFAGNDALHNENMRINHADFLGSFTTNGLEVGNYSSPDFKFTYLSELDDNTYIQLAFFNYGEDAGACDDPPLPPPSSPGSPNTSMYEAALMENIIFDCDHKNITFGLDVALKPINMSNDCNVRLYRAELLTACPNVVYENFNITYNVLNNQNQLLKSFTSNGRFTDFYMDDLASGMYKIEAVYNTANGYNILVNSLLGGGPLFTFNHEQNASYKIFGNVTFDTPIFAPADIEVMPGATLTILSDVSFNLGKKLVVHPGANLQLVQGSHLKSCYGDWLGVRVYGGGIVNANGTISNAQIGIKSENGGAAQITTNGAQFIDNIVGVHVTNEAIPLILNSQFVGGTKGVNMQDCTGGTTTNGVLFEGNTFSYQTDAGIASINSQINVRNGNQFIGCAIGVSLRNLLGIHDQSIIGSFGGSGNSNVFSNCDIGVYANASKQTVQNNIFNYCNQGTYMSGVNSYESNTNSFLGGYNAEGLFSAGAQSNISERNDHSRSTYGIRAFYENDNYTFLANCFSSSGTDVEAYGTISGAQGDLGVAASNCFTHANFVDDFICNTSNNVLYYVPKPTVSYPPCLVPSTPGTYSVEHESDDDRPVVCGTTLGNPPIGEYDYIKILGCDSSKIHTLIAHYNRELGKIRSSKPPLTKNQRATIAWLTRHLRYLINQWAWCLKRQGRYPELYNWYKAQEGKDYAINAVAVKVTMQQYDTAIAELQALSSIYSLNNAIVDAMILNITYTRKDIAASAPTSSHINLLRTVAAMSDPYAAYGRALLYHLTGEKVEPVLPETAPRSLTNVDDRVNEIYTINPNPTSDFIKISIDNAVENDTYGYEILDMTGNIVNIGSLSTQMSIDVSGMPSGIYFVHIMKNRIAETVHKIVILK